MSARQRAFTTILFLVLCLVGAACGVPRDADPRALPATDVPFGLLDPSTTAAGTPSSVDPEDPGTVLVYLVDSRDELLVEVARQVRPPANVSDAIEALLAQPAEAELARGYGTRIPPETRLIDVELILELVTINLSEDFLASSDALLGFAQVVFTANQAAGIEEVLFEIEGEPIEAIGGDGELTAEPLTVNDYATVAPLPTEPPDDTTTSQPGVG